MNTRRVVRYIPVAEGDVVDLPKTGIPGLQRRGYPGGSGGTYTIGTPASGFGGPAWRQAFDAAHIILGYMPAPFNPRARKAYQPTGWLVVLIDESVAQQPKRLNRGAKAVAA